jgi:hypothetical protein
MPNDLECPPSKGLIAEARAAYRAARDARAAVCAHYRAVTRPRPAGNVPGEASPLTPAEDVHAAAMAVLETEEARNQDRRVKRAEATTLEKLLHDHDAAEQQRRRELDALMA